MRRLKIAGVQMDIKIADTQFNLEKIESYAQECKVAGAWMTIFPECTTTGYCFHSIEEAVPLSEPHDGSTYDRVHQLAQQLEMYIVYGYLEREGDNIFNSLSCVGPTGIVGRYRKVHLPMLGIDRFTTPGTEFHTFEVDNVRVGLCICYDSSFPEASRVLTLQGADLIVLPTNWPPTSGLTADVIPAARALENHVYFAAINRVGNERGFEFIGKSSISAPNGKVLASAKDDRETIIYAEIDPMFARQKHLVNIPGEHEVHRTKDRRPDSYSLLTKS